ncbi:acyl carrier protein [Gammaproteobacteria bacterium]
MNNSELLAQEVARWIGKILQREIDPSKLDASLVEDYGAASMDMVDIAETLERKYNIVVPDAQIFNFRTLKDVLLRIQS